LAFERLAREILDFPRQASMASSWRDIENFIADKTWCRWAGRIEAHPTLLDGFSPLGPVGVKFA